MILIGMLDRFLDAFGLIYVVLTVIKIARGYPIKRWFF